MSKWLKMNGSRRFANPSSFLSRLRRDTRGNTLAMAAAALVPIAGMIGSGLDMSRAYMAQAKLQNACDAAALGARREMAGSVFDSGVVDAGTEFFDFNFPATTMNAQNVTRTVAQSTTSDTTVEVRASADIPTTVMSLFGQDTISISVACDADQDFGNNDVMVVLDVTGSMNGAPSGGGASKISRLRTGAMGLYRALADTPNTRTRFGFVPYSMNVNVGRILRTRDILRTTFYPQDSDGDGDEEYVGVNIVDTEWNDDGNFDAMGNGIDRSGRNQNRSNRNWRLSGSACVEERPTIGNPYNDGDFDIDLTVTQDDIDLIARNNNDQDRQYGRWDPDENEYDDDGWCPSPATRLRTYGNETAYQNAVNDATAIVNGNTYHDLGLIWAARLLSPTGLNASRNPTTYNGIPVAQHIVFLTDGDLVPTSNNYSSFGNWNFNRRLTGSGNQESRHIARFLSACSTAKSMGMTIWIIAFDNVDTDEVEPCATSSGHFFITDGSDLEEVFERIGAGIGRLRLTQ
ncbi:MAG: TadE/TadG family type IV pilus assembly protein [Pseudomonadota bacterium]